MDTFPVFLAAIQVNEMERPRFNRITKLLDRLDSYSDLRALFLLGLTDSETPSGFRLLAAKGFPLSASATTRHLLTYASRRLGKGRLDRELRDDVWPRLHELGIIQRSYVLSKRDSLAGNRAPIEYGAHPIAKSPNNSYALTVEARNLLTNNRPEFEWDEELESFVNGTTERRLRALQRNTSSAVKGNHSQLIDSVLAALQATLLRDYRLVFVDDADEERIKRKWENELATRGLLPNLDSLWPDAILVNDGDRVLWYVDAVTSDGEIDEIRRLELAQWALARGYRVAGYTTAYASWSRAGARQTKMKNLAVNTTMWIAEDGGKLFSVRSLVEP